MKKVLPLLLVIFTFTTTAIHAFPYENRQLYQNDVLVPEEITEDRKILQLQEQIDGLGRKLNEKMDDRQTADVLTKAQKAQIVLLASLTTVSKLRILSLFHRMTQGHL